MTFLIIIQIVLLVAACIICGVNIGLLLAITPYRRAESGNTHKWHRNQTTATCSVCGHREPADTTLERCPSCGATMEEAAE